MQDAPSFMVIPSSDKIDTVAYAPLQIVDVPPAQFDEPILWVDRIDRQFAPVALPVKHNVDATLTSTNIQSVEGYRIQIYTGREASAAHRLESEARGSCPLTVYLSFEAPQYKVRLGDFATRDEALEWCDRLKRSGFNDAWVVRTTIFQAK